MLFIENRIRHHERDLCLILADLACHIHPLVVKKIQQRNREEYSFFKDLFSGLIEIDDYLFNGSACVFPGVRRYVSGQGKKKQYNPSYKAIVDDNIFPRHIWCFLENGKTYSGPNWKNSGLGEFELAHVFTHKESELQFESHFFRKVKDGLFPYGDFSCACNVVLLPKGTVRPTDNSRIIKSAFYMRYIELYGERPLNGRSRFDKSQAPEWYKDLRWNEPSLPIDWEEKVEKLLIYRTKRLTEILEK